MNNEKVVYIEDLNSFEKSVYEQSKFEGFTIGATFGALIGGVVGFATVVSGLIMGWF